MQRRSSSGFTLVELMVVVAITGLLASVAVPTFMKYIAKSKSVEATQNIRRMYEGARAYYLAMGVSRGEISQTIDFQFPTSLGPTPAVSCCLLNGGKCNAAPAFWDQPTWNALAFDISDPFYYQYEFVANPAGTVPSFTARALGDIDCDGRLSTFEMVAHSTSAFRDTVGSGAFYRNNETE